MVEEQGSNLRSGLVTAVLLISGILLLILPIPALRWAQAPFPGFFIDPNLVVNAIGEASWPAKLVEPPLTYPERVAAVDGVPVGTAAELGAALRAYEPGAEIVITLRQPGEDAGVAPTAAVASREVTVGLTAVSFIDLWRYFWLLYLIALIIFGLGAWVFIARPRTVTAQLFALLTTFMALGAGTLFDALTSQLYIRVWIAALALSCGFNVLLALTFPHPVRLLRRYPPLRWTVLIPGLVVGLWAQLTLFDPVQAWRYVTAWRVLFLLNGIGVAFVIGMMAYRGWRSPSTTVRQQARLILAGSVVAYLPLLIYFFLSALRVELGWFPILPVLPLLLIYPLVLGYAIIRYRLLGIDRVLRQGLTYALLLGLLVSAATFIMLGLTSLFGGMINLGSPMIIVTFILLVVLLFEPLRNRLQVEVDRLFFGRPVAFEQLLQTFHRELTAAVTVEEVAETLLQYIQAGIVDSRADLYLPDRQMNFYRSLRRDRELVLPVDSLLVAELARAEDVIDLAERRAWPAALIAHEEVIVALDAQVLAPFNSGEDLLALLTLAGEKERPSFSQAELSYLRTLADQTLIALERANVVRRLEARVADLDTLSQFSQALNFTIAFDDLLELIFINYLRTFDVGDFFIYLRDAATEQTFPVFVLRDGERLSEEEGRRQTVPGEQMVVHDVIERGQMVVGADPAGRTTVAAPLNAGASAIGAMFTIFPQAEETFRARQQQLFAVFADRAATAIDRLQANRRLQQRAQQLEIINEVTFTLASTLELEPLLALILDKAMALLDTEAGTFMLTLPDTGELEFRVARGPASEGLIGRRLPLGTGLAGTAAQSGRPILVNRVQEDKRWFSQVDEASNFQSQSILTVPLLRQSTVLGVLQVINKVNGALFTAEDQQLLIAFAGQAVVALENARLWEQTDQALQRSVDELSLLQQLDRDLNATLELDHILNLTLERTLHICHGRAGAIVLIDEGGDPLRIVTRDYETSLQPAQVEARLGLIGRVLRSGKPHVAPNVHEEEDYIPFNFNTHSQLTLPFLNKQSLIGAIAIESDEIDAFPPRVVETAVRVTTHAAAAIANAVLLERINEANRAKSEFVSMVSHELKTPMTSMRGYTDLMLSGMTGDLTDQQRGFLETIAANIRRMSRQIRDLTDISRIETGQLHIEPKPTLFLPIVNETLQSIKGPCDEKGIRLQLEMPEDLPLILADKERIVQVLTNLLSNACKYSPPGSDVRLSFSYVERNGENGSGPRPMVLCQVQDNGYGMSEADMAQLFTKFFRSDDPNIRQAKGTGLGLSITKGIVELHGGEIWVESSLSEGSTFSFTVPLATEETR